MNRNREDRLLAQRFETIFNEYFSAVKYFALMLLKSEEDAEDIAQDVFAILWTQPQVWNEKRELAPYIYTITKRATLNFIKHKKVEQAYQEKIIEKNLIEELFQSEDPLNPIYYKEAQLVIKLVLERLPERRRTIFEMSRFEKMSNNEIAEKMNISIRTVEHHIYLTLLEMKKAIFIAFFWYFI